MHAVGEYAITSVILCMFVCIFKPKKGVSSNIKTAKILDFL